MSNQTVGTDQLSEEQIKAFLQNEVTWYYSDETDFKGPFTDNQIIQLIHKDNINHSVKMWNKKYDFWIPILEVKKFATVLESKRVVVKSTSAATSAEQTEKEFQWKNSDEFWKYMEQKHPHLHHKPLIEFEVDDKAPHAIRPAWMAVAAGFVVSAVLGLFLYSEFNPTAITHGLLNKQQNNEAEIVKQSSIKKYGVRTKAFVANATNDNLAIVAATNLADGATVNVKLEGVTDTLVGGFEYRFAQNIVVKDGFAEITDVHTPYQGEYVLTLDCNQCSNVLIAQNTVLYREKIFLGGQKNQQYDLALLRYHTDLRNQVREELDNLNQIDDALNSQFQMAVARRTDGMWNQMQSQLNVEHAKMNEQNENGKFFYKEILEMLSKNFQILKSVQTEKKQTIIAELKNEFLVNSASIKRATNEMMKMPLTANGMPQK